jgi:hypothetical protein
MPVLGGFAVLEQIKRDQNFSRLRVIALTAYGMEDDRARVLAAGFDAHVSRTTSWVRKPLAGIYAALVNDASRNEMIANDIVRAIESGRCPLLLTGRTEHLQYFAAKLAGVAKHVFVLKGGMGKKQRRITAEALASVPENESRVILATGSYVGEGFDDARLDTLGPYDPTCA